jgi:predicted amidophosphoribosyltransferase
VSERPLTSRGLECIECRARFRGNPTYCPLCGGLLRSTAEGTVVGRYRIERWRRSTSTMTEWEATSLALSELREELDAIRFG